MLRVCCEPKYKGAAACSVIPLESRSFEEKQIFQEEQKTICAIIMPALGIFFKSSASIWIILYIDGLKFQKSLFFGL